MSLNINSRERKRGRGKNEEFMTRNSASHAGHNPYHRSSDEPA